MNEIYISRDKRNLGHNGSASVVKKAVSRVLEAEGIDCGCIVSVLFTDDTGIREMNSRFRDTDRVTDVLSFPMNELKPGAFSYDVCEISPESGYVILGDIMLNLEQCARQADEYGHSYDREIAYLTVHSMLHLLGYDHVDEGAEKKMMRDREKEIIGDC